MIAAFLFPFVYWFGSAPDILIPKLNTAGTFIYNLFYVNVFLAIFNLLPAFPTDGGRIFRALLSMKWDRVKATVIAARVGQVISVGFFFIGLFSSPFLAIIGIFIFLMAYNETEYVKSKSVLHDYCVRDVVMRKFFSLNALDTVLNGVKLLLDVQATDFVVVDDHNHVIGTINRDGIVKALAERGKDGIIAEVMNKKTIFLTPEMPLDKVYSLFQTSESSIFPVVLDKQLLGIIDMSNIIEFIMIKAAAEKSPVHIHHSHKDYIPMKTTASSL
jgi:CBS domain-containing protein